MSPQATWESIKRGKYSIEEIDAIRERVVWRLKDPTWFDQMLRARQRLLSRLAGKEGLDARLHLRGERFPLVTSSATTGIDGKVHNYTAHGPAQRGDVAS